MKSYLFEYFRYTRTERNGIIILSSLCLMLISFYHLQDFIFKDNMDSIQEYEEIYCSLFEEVPLKKNIPINYFDFDPNTASTEDLIKLGVPPKASATLVNYRKSGAKFYEADDLKKVYGFGGNLIEKLKPYMKFPRKNKAVAASFSSKPQAPRKELSLFYFNPNECSKEELLKLGLGERVSNTIIKFREKVKFKKPEDFKKIYGLDDHKYAQLLPYLMFPKIEEEVFKKKDFEAFAKSEKVIIDINSADENEWQKISGIGPTFSKRIVKFRGKLGGFHSIDQVSETFGMTDSTFQAIKPYLKKEADLNKIKINKVELEELRSHPYIKWKHAKVLINYRKHHGPYKSAEDLSKVKVLSEQKIEQLLPYLSFE